MHIYIYIYVYRERERDVQVCVYTYIYIYIYIYMSVVPKAQIVLTCLLQSLRESDRHGMDTGKSVRPFVILRIVRPRIFESTFRNHCAKKLDGALRKSTSFV